MIARLEMRCVAASIEPDAPREAPALLTSDGRDRPSGVAMLIGPDRGAARAYVCNRLAHSIDVFDPEGRRLLSFGAFGKLPGSFNEPADVLVLPTGSHLTHITAEPALVAVADRENHRVQIFEPDGTLRALLEWTRPLSRFGRSRWRSILEIEVENLALPTRLEWHAPWLDITTYEQRVVRVDLERVCRAAAEAANRRLVRRAAHRPSREWTPSGRSIDVVRPAMVAKSA